MRKLLSLLITILLVPASVSGAIPDVKFRRLDTHNGLSNSQVNCVYRDSRGYVWIGTAYGLNRYDGYRVKTFYSNRRDTTSMRDNYTDQVMEDWQGKLWLKQGMSYCVYDPVTERFERDVNREVEQYLGPNYAVERVYIDGRKRLWVKFYEQGISCYDHETKKVTKFQLGYGPNEFKPHYGISSMADYADGIVVATNCGELLYLNGKQGTVEWESTWMRDHGGPENQDYKVFVDQQATIWVTSFQRTFVYQPKSGRWHASVPDMLHDMGVTDMPEQIEIWDVKVDSHGWVWVATDHQGIFVIDPKTREVRQFQSNKYDETSLSDNTPRHLYMDAEGQVWVGTYKNGVNQYIEGLASIRNLELGDINTVVEDRQGRYWLGTNDRGIIVYDPKTGEQTHYTMANSPLSSNVMVGSCMASDGSIWFGSYNGGLVHCIPGGQQSPATIVNYRASDGRYGLSSNNVWSVTEDRWHRIWIGTLGGGIQRLDPATGHFVTWNTKNTKMPSDYLTSLSWIKKGWLMAGTSWYWAFLNPVTGKLAVRMPPNYDDLPANAGNTVCVMEDSRGLIWQGSASGALVFDQQTRRDWLLDMTTGLYGSSVTSIVEDQEHMMWVVTDHGVSKVVPERQDDGTWQFIVRSYNNRDGLQQGTYNQRSAWLTRDGLLLIGGQDGLDIINPKALSNQQSKERPVFSGLQIFDVDVPVGGEVDGRVILAGALDVCHKLTLRYNDQFTIQLASDAGKVNNGKRFVYRLDGFNDNWVKTSELNPNITYNSLRAGSYTLRVRMLNDDGTFGEEESTLGITIRPPLWRTRWMILLYMLLIAALAWLWRRSFLKRQEKQMKVETVRRELEKQQWMNEMRLQMAREQSSGMEKPEPEVSDELVLHVLPTELVDFVRQVCDDYKPDSSGHRVRINFLSSVRSLDVDVDEDQLRDALYILFKNSIAFSPDECHISVGVARTQDNYAQIQVADNGIGIRDEFKEHAFDPFVDGQGIGLDRVKAVVVAHGGSIRIDDNPGGGTIFIITLPLAPEELIEEAEVVVED